MQLTIGFIGFGLIAGSIARALKNASSEYSLLAYQYSETPSKGLLQAKEEQILDTITTQLSDFSSCDIIFLCAPVDKNLEYVRTLAPYLSPNCLLTDVGSVKGNIHEVIEELGLTGQFIGGHPMTGSEKTGYDASDSLLLENAYYILTPTADTKQETLDFYYELVKQMGALPIVLDSDEHDEITAAISHVPHIIAAELVNLVRNSDDLADKMRTLAAGGFKDITRIASSSPVIWRSICLSNVESIKTVLKRYITSLQNAYEALEEQDGTYLYKMFETAGEFRDSLPTRKGSIPRIYELFVDLRDEAGAIATIATLAANQLSIKNIGIIHNREFEQGVLRIEFYEEHTLASAVTLLKNYHYTVYERK